MLFIFLVIIVSNTLLGLNALRGGVARYKHYLLHTSLVAIAGILRLSESEWCQLLWPLLLGAFFNVFLALSPRARRALWLGVALGVGVVLLGHTRLLHILSVPLLWGSALLYRRFRPEIDAQCATAPLFLSATLIFKLLYTGPFSPPFCLMGLTVANIIFGYSMFIRDRFEEQITRLDLLNAELKREIAQRRESEEARVFLTQQLQKAQRMEALGRLAGGVAHDFNNQLNAISAAVEFILLDLPSDSPIRDDVEEILKAVKRSQSLTQQLLVFGRKQVSQPRALDLNKQLKRTLKMVERLSEATHSVTFIEGEGLPAVFMDPTQLEQIVMNLMVNGLQAMPEGGALTLRTAPSGAAHDPSFVLISVEDTGAGMDEPTQRRVFDPFFTTKLSGTGLGLSMVYGLVEGNQGMIELHSAPNEGTRFEIYLPRSSLVVTSTDELERVNPSEIRLRARILFVEDEEVVRRYLARLLRHQGHSVKEARDAEHALELFEEGATDLLISDVFLPGINGKALADRLRARAPALPVLFISGYSDQVLGERGVLAEGTHLLHKPFSISELQAKIAEVLPATMTSGVSS